MQSRAGHNPILGYLAAPLLFFLSGASFAGPVAKPPDPDVAQVSKPAVSRVSQPADPRNYGVPRSTRACRFGNRRYSRFENLPYEDLTSIKV